MAKILKNSCGLPILMCKGSAHRPQRFWEYTLAYTPKQRDELKEQGYIVSVADKQTDEDGKITIPDSLYDEWWEQRKRSIPIF